MALNLSMPEALELRPRITVFGVGGAGGNAVNNMIAKQLEGCDFVVANTDAQALAQSTSTSQIQLGTQVTQGLGAGARPEVGAGAAEESIEAIVDQVAGAHMCFITAGMGGGTGTGAAPIIARAARELGVLTVGVVTKPFTFEGTKRMRIAEAGVDELQKVVDTLIIIPNQNLFRIANERTTFTEAFSMADDVLYQGVKGVTDLMVRPGIINLDFADVRSVMDEMGKAMMGTGESEGEDRARQAAEKAIANPLLDEISLKGAKGVLINVTGGDDLTLFELDEAANRIREEVDPEANIIVGSTLDSSLEGVMRVSVVATGIDAVDVQRPVRKPPAPMMTEPASQPVAQPADAAPAPAPEPVAAEAPAPQPAAPAAAPQPATQAAPVVAADTPETVPAPAAEFVDRQHAPEPAPAPEPEAQTRRPGEPSPETLRRLQAAVTKQPEDAPARPVEAPRAVEPEEEEKGGRFAINSLIHRMTGHQAQPAPEPQRPARTAREPDREKVEIPAFLRRQAN